MGRLYLWMLLPVLSILPLVNAYCARFQFPAIEDSANLTVKRNTSVAIPFSLNTDHCNITHDFIISISKLDKQRTAVQQVCRLVVNGSDHVSDWSAMCKAADEKGNYSLTKLMDESDGTWWLWRTSDENIAPEAVMLIQIQIDAERPEGDESDQNKTVCGPVSPPASKDHYLLPFVTVSPIAAAMLIMVVRLVLYVTRNRGWLGRCAGATHTPEMGGKENQEEDTSQRRSWEQAAACPAQEAYSSELNAQQAQADDSCNIYDVPPARIPQDVPNGKTEKDC